MPSTASGASAIRRNATQSHQLLLQDPEIQAKVVWEGMAVVRPWEAIPAAVTAMEPHIFENISTRNGDLEEEQKEVLQVSWHSGRVSEMFTLEQMIAGLGICLACGPIEHLAAC